MTDHRSPKDIEQEIERERAGLGDTLETLQNRFSVDNVVRQIGDQLREHGGEMSASVSRSVRDNPMALALTGVGLAWMIFGNRTSNDRDDRRPYVGDHNSNDYGTYRRPDDAAVRQHDSRPGRTRGIAGTADLPMWAGGNDSMSDNRTMADRARTAGHTAQNRISSAVGSVSDSASETAHDLAEKASDAAHRMSDAADDAGERMRSAAQSATAHAADLRARLAHGTEALSEEARERVIAARERAMDARDTAARYARKAGDRTVDMFEEQPLVAGALAIALGAAIGATLPRTRTEDHYFGEQSDALMDEAERMFDEERAKVTKVAQAAMNEAHDVADEAADAVKSKVADAKAKADSDASEDTAVEAVAQRAKEAGQRVADAAKNEAKKQDLGKPRT
jgi:ElaB/YqjD/DUF883 family membrane-anchored ribosome-binding protein